MWKIKRRVMEWRKKWNSQISLFCDFSKGKWTFWKESRNSFNEIIVGRIEKSCIHLRNQAKRNIRIKWKIKFYKCLNIHKANWSTKLRKDHIKIKYWSSFV